MSLKYTLSWNDVNEAYKKLSKLEVQDTTASAYLILDKTNPLNDSLVLKDQGLILKRNKDASYKVSFLRGGAVSEFGVITPHKSYTVVNGLPVMEDETQPMAYPVEDKNEPEMEKTSGLHFGDAIERIKRGQAVARAGWNGKGMFVYYVPAASYPAQTGVAKEFFGENALVPYNAYMAIKNVNDTVSTWVPSVSDTLAEDWYVFQFSTVKDDVEKLANDIKNHKSELDKLLSEARKGKLMNFSDATLIMEMGHRAIRAGSSFSIKVNHKLGVYQTNDGELYHVTRTDINSKEWKFVQ